MKTLVVESPEPPTVQYVMWDGPGSVYARSLYLPLWQRTRLSVEVLQVTYGSMDEMKQTARVARELGLGYRGYWFGRRADAMANLVSGAGAVLRAALRSRSTRTVVVARSLVPALAVMSVGVPSRRFVYDADGLSADERVDFAGWRRDDRRYRLARRVESAAVQSAAITLTRTERARRILVSRVPEAPVRVVRNGSDEQKFRLLADDARSRLRRQLGSGPDDFVVVYCGSLGPQYRTDLMVEFVRALRAASLGRRVVFRVLTTGRPDPLLHGLGDTTIDSVDPSRIPDELGAADLALAFRTPTYSQQAVSPIKVGEYLLAGLPLVTNRGVGDLDSLLSDDVAVFVDKLDPAAVRQAADRVARTQLSWRTARESARALGERSFGLNEAAAGYAASVRLLARGLFR